jgi:hypothetical protein
MDKRRGYRMLRRWNYQKKEYDPYYVPSDMRVFLVCSDMDEPIDCPHCGKAISFGEGYTSLEIHNGMGFGYTVCEECHCKELERARSSYE